MFNSNTGVGPGAPNLIQLAAILHAHALGGQMPTVAGPGPQDPFSAARINLIQAILGQGGGGPQPAQRYPGARGIAPGGPQPAQRGYPTGPLPAPVFVGPNQPAQRVNPNARPVPTPIFVGPNQPAQRSGPLGQRPAPGSVRNLY